MQLLKVVDKQTAEKIGQPGTPVIGEGFAPADAKKLIDMTARLLHYIRGDYCIAGGVATQAQLAAHYGKQITPRPFNDLDLVMRAFTDLDPAILSEQLLCHFHPTVATEDGFYIALIDKKTGLKTDIFGWDRFPPQRQQAQLGNTTVPIRSAADLLIIFVSSMYRRAITGQPMIRKQLDDARALARIVNPSQAQQLWQRRHPDSPQAWRAALSTVEQYVTSHPDCFQPKKAIDPSQPHDCPECASVAPYQITPTPEILAFLRAKR